MARTQGSHSDITGPRIQAAALRLFAQHGYAAVSMRQIAAEVGVQAGALYNYTPDKQSLLFSLMQRHMSELMAAWQADPAVEDALGELERFVRFHIRFHMERPDAVFIAYMELRNLSDENFAVIETMRRNYEDALEAVLKQGVEEGVFRIPDTKIATLAVIAMLNGVMTWYRTGGRLSLQEVETIYWDMVRKAVAA
ncbi:TetR/AcrR family transcriptional regulator [Phaeobacter gallaeciensis]|uniref:TetR/AcrR family transcriptional regulator n=1 Tax=Phaeobacter gallaeciensis TaxID=60890 RepID=UPI00237F0667|nr:TetR/AcrR family transcriptional regulator [Phaeobacter gallaeciensis]MDE4190977.1 TetR/AcrR family transcriptional regulator [Phaeobacter gallaeciensis]MDE4199443.1 TetR/AcrR family transcriptional regulator [Phaeobacter gallaeciensis]MDE4203591.1 TetR/AcrR family transcriptional regulator [Phaeobacter gallaeciensis]MDE4207733.1 TetR/AcrR family transcriptional regulator [Phaeobacter gallaeciensis]MDE4216100.1 TetR/AcrR family transcriptional regulator [Phaeobacter gallaeciensis]